jgi:xanthine dehydrogenase FAD-binding subunit
MAVSQAAEPIVQEFTYERPETIEEAVAAMAAGDARALAGGTDLIPQLREGRRLARRLVDLKHIAELTATTPLPDGGILIGAASTARTVSRHTALAEVYPAISRSARLIGGAQIQNRASLGGNICNAAPSADAIPALICYQAQALIAGRKGRREVAIETVLRGPGQTALAPDEVLIAIRLPPSPPRSAASYLRFTPRREMDIAVAGVGTLICLHGDGTIAAARVVLASVAPTPIRARSAEQCLVGEKPTGTLIKEVGRLAAGDARPISDTRGSADYRRSLIGVLTARALADCLHALNVEVVQS